MRTKQELIDTIAWLDTESYLYTYQCIAEYVKSLKMDDEGNVTGDLPQHFISREVCENRTMWQILGITFRISFTRIGLMLKSIVNQYLG